ncbi:hypothetical protein C6499_07240 [Candidatus Poribacteria bacterium]|nr:MAG: hypothetical protein C6499_07240 [Candidatus Poribacteria bacterium]
MKLQISFAILLLLAMVAFAGCYTQLGYHASSDYGRIHPKHHEGLTKAETETGHTDAVDSDASELERADEEDSDGYYGRRKRSYRTTYAAPYRYDSYWVPYGPYPSYAYSPVWYYPYRPFYGYSRYYYGYRAPYYRYYSGYYPYRNVYRRYHSGSRYTPLSRRTYKKGDLRVGNRRSRSSRSVTSPSPRSRSERLRVRDQNKK